MTKKDLDSFKKRLLQDRKQLLDNISRENQELQSSEVDEGDIVDIASASYDKNFLIGLMDRVERDQLEKIDSALQRIEEGTFGKCITCGKIIDETRLKVMPVSLKCIACKQNEDTNDGYGFAMQAAPPFSSSSSKPAAKKKTASKKTTTKKAAAKKSSAKKSTAKKTTAKKATAGKKTVKKTAAKKTAAKKAPAKKTAVKKAAPKKAAAKKSGAKKTAKKTAAKKTGRK